MVLRIPIPQDIPQVQMQPSGAGIGALTRKYRGIQHPHICWFFDTAALVIDCYIAVLLVMEVVSPIFKLPRPRKLKIYSLNFDTDLPSPTQNLVEPHRAQNIAPVERARSTIAEHEFG